jgi:hypothetical protein
LTYRLQKLKQEAAFMSAPAKLASYGVFPHAREFTYYVGDDYISLSYRLGDIDPGELWVSHNSNTVTLEILPTCKGYVIECPQFVWSVMGKLTPELESHFEHFQDLKWDTASSSELISYFEDKLLNVMKSSEWGERAIRMLTPLIEALCELRDDHDYPFNFTDIRSSMPLHGYEKLSRVTLLSPHTRSVLENYLSQYEKVAGEEGVLAWSEASIEQHAYLTMQISCCLGTGYKEGGRRDYRLAPAVIHFEVEKPIVSFSYSFNKDDVFIHAYFTDKPARV